MSAENHKNQYKPLEEDEGQSPSVMLPLWSCKSKLLTPKVKALHYLLSEGYHPLQGDKQEINLFLEETYVVSFPLLCKFHFGYRRKVYFLFIALRLMQNPIG